MDKGLKKLSRVELLELMVNLSEDYERLRAENARLKKMVSAQRLPRSTKVGSIADAALQANGYFEAAQRSADEYLREIKHLRDELAVRANNVQAAAAANQRNEEQARAMVRDAQARANQIVARANSQAEAILADARARSEETLANANRQSHAILNQAGQRVSAAPGLDSLPSIAPYAGSEGRGMQGGGAGAYPQAQATQRAYGAPASSASYQPRAVAGATGRAASGAGYGQSAPYSGNRGYVTSAPAYAGGTAATASSSASPELSLPQVRPAYPTDRRAAR